MENEKVTLVAGVINATQKMLYWKLDKGRMINVGKYAIVENTNGYDLIKVVGVIDTTKREASKFSNTKYDNMKRVLSRVNVDVLIM